MTLTGGWLLATVAVLTTATLAGTVLLWPRLAGPGPGAVSGRVAILLAGNLLVLVLVAVAANDAFDLFSDWNDLTGALAAGAGAPAGAFRGRTPPRGALGAAPLSARRGTLPSDPAGRASEITYQVTGARSGLTGQVDVQLPPSYRDPTRAHVLYPVLQTFSGYPGGTQQWIRTMGLPQALEDAAVAGRARTALIVSATTQIPPGQDTECVDGGPSARLETWLTEDVPDWVGRTFRVETDRRAWATIGLSAGGWCAAMAAMLHPDRYAAALVMAGYFRPQFSGPAPYPPSGPQATRYDLVRLARTSPPAVALWIETSPTDPVSYPSTAALLAAAQAPLSVQGDVLADAGHRLTVWKGLLPQALTWLGSDVPGFRPAPP